MVVGDKELGGKAAFTLGRGISHCTREGGGNRKEITGVQGGEGKI